MVLYPSEPCKRRADELTREAAEEDGGGEEVPRADEKYEQPEDADSGEESSTSEM